MKIGLFDHVEHGNRPLATLFDERLTFVKAADEVGFYCLHVAEHHATPLNMVPAYSATSSWLIRTRRRRGSPSRPWMPPAPHYVRGYGAMFSQHIGQADEGCDFDFLAGKGQIAEPEIH